MYLLNPNQRTALVKHWQRAEFKQKGKIMNVENNSPVVDQPLETDKRDYTIDDNGDVTLDSVTIDTDGPVEIFVQAKEDFEGASPVNR